jgi:hypothetical protein
VFQEVARRRVRAEVVHPNTEIRIGVFERDDTYLIRGPPRFEAIPDDIYRVYAQYKLAVLIKVAYLSRW